MPATTWWGAAVLLALPSCKGEACVGGDCHGGRDGGADADADADGACTLGMPLGCDFLCNDPEAPDFRVSHLEWTAPAAFTGPVVQGATNAALDEQGSALLLDTTARGGFTMGDGRCEAADPSHCSFDPDGPPPAAGTWTYDSLSGDFLLPSSGGTDLDLSVQFMCPMCGPGPCDLPPCDPRVLLPLRSLILSGSVSHVANCIGSRTNESTPTEWETGAVLTAKITLQDARTVLWSTKTLCDVISGDPCDDDPDPTSWNHPPDTDVDGEPAWTVRAGFAAIGVVIEER